MIQAAFRAQEVNPAKLAQLYRKEFELCGVKKGETISVVSDLILEYKPGPPPKVVKKR